MGIAMVHAIEEPAEELARQKSVCTVRPLGEPAMAFAIALGLLSMAPIVPHDVGPKLGEECQTMKLAQ